MKTLPLPLVKIIGFLLALVSLLSLGACTASETPPVGSFVDSEPADYVSLQPIVWEYFYNLKAAVIAGDIQAFHSRYPALASGEDAELGINAEAHRVKSYLGFALIDGDVFPEYYQRFKIKPVDDEIHILIHGLELYAYRDAQGVISKSGGEFKIVLYLQPSAGGWEIVQTDEVTLSEWQDFPD